MPGLPAAWLAGLSPSFQVLARRGELRRYRKGTLLIQEGDQGDTIYLIVTGRLRAFSSSDSGREVTFGVYGPGEYMGEMSLDGGPRSASVITTEASSCVVITRQTLIQHIAEHPEFAFELLSKVIRRARHVTLSVKQLALNDVYGRLKSLLEQIHDDIVAGLSAPERLTHQEIANRIGCSREMVSRLLKDLEVGGFIAQSARSIEVLKRLPPRW